MALHNFLHWPALLTSLLVVWLSLRILYRLFLHPLARFPGPKLGAITNLWAASYDLNAKSCVVKILPRLHERYGPIVRFRPDELHIADFDAYSQVFKAGSKFNRDLDLYGNPQVDGSILNTADGEVAKPHKNLYVGAFSKSAVTQLEPLIHEKLNIFLSRLDSTAFKQSCVNIDTGYNCLTGDIVMAYSYGQTFGFLDAPDFKAPMVKDMRDSGPVIVVFWYAPRLGHIMNYITERMSDASLRKYFPPIAAAARNLVNQCRDRITSLNALPISAPELQTSIFKNALHPNTEKGQYVATPKELVGDAVLIFLAGTDTTASALTLGTWNILSDPSILAKLTAELDQAMPDPERTYSQSHLETLPYLRAIIKESLRFSHGASARLMRIVPPGGAVMCGQHVPAGTKIGFSNYVYNNDPKVFVEPYRFQPERWLAKDITELEARMVSFSRGSRSCLGINLAYAELYVTFAHVFRRFKLELVDMKAEDMDWKDCFTPRMHGHLKVKIERRRT